MDAARWERMEAIFLAALEQPPAARHAFVEATTDGDPDLAADVRRLLDDWDRDPDFLETPVARVADLPATESQAEDREDEPIGPDLPSAPRRIGPYRLVRPLGQGGMGEVHLAIQEGDGFERAVALKVVRPGLDTAETLRRFRLERRVLAGLGHPNIAALLDGGVTDDGRPFLVMELVDGEPIDAWCDDRRLDVQARVRLVRTICEAVQHAHQRLVLHRDLKPANILVTPEGAPKLLDFGIAKLLEGDVEAGTTRTEARMITPEYAAPEQIRGDDASAATDVFGLGVLLFELLTGARPHPARTTDWDARERAVLDDLPTRPSAAVTGSADAIEAARRRGVDPGRLRRRLRGDLDTIVLKALRKEPDRRYPSVAALADDLGRYLEGLPVWARSDSLGYRASKFLRRNALPVAATAAVAATLLGATVVSGVQARRAAAERDEALEVRGFLLEMFGATGPDQAAGDSVTARALLDRQARALETTYADRPLLRGEMMMVLAEGYDRLGLLDRADSLAGRALRVRRSELGETHPEVASSLALLGWVRHQGGDAEGADTLLSTAIALLDEDGSDDRTLSRALNDLGVVREAAGAYDEAEALYLEALATRRGVFGPEHRAVAVTASNLAVIRYRRGDHAAAVEAGTEALAAMRASVGPDHQRSVVIQQNLAAFRIAMGDDDGAVAEYRDLLTRQERIQGPDHPVTVGVMNALAGVLGNVGEWAESETVARRALAAQEARLGPDNPNNGILLVRIGQALTGLERHDDAVPALERALALFRPALPDDHPRLAEAMESLADAIESTDPVRAEVLHRDAVAMLERRFGERHAAAGMARTRLADRLKVRGDAAGALPLYERAHRDLLEALRPDHPFVHRTRVRLAEMHRALGDVPTADSLLTAARAAFALGGADPELVAFADTLAARWNAGGR